MRILLALDGSTGADTARALVGHLTWPTPSSVDVIRVIEPSWAWMATPGITFGGPMDEVLGADETRRELDRSIADLARPGLEVAAQRYFATHKHSLRIRLAGCLNRHFRG